MTGAGVPREQQHHEGRTLVLANPSSGGGRAAKAARDLATRRDIAVHVPEDVAALRHAVRAAADRGVERLFVAGGDGTVHHVVQDLAGRPTALGILPCGSGNDLARALKLPLDPRAALERQLAAPPGAVRRIDLGRAGHVLYAGVAGLGLDGEVASRAARVRRLRGPWIYPWALVCALARFRPPHLVVEDAAGRFEGAALLAAAANTPVFGGGMRIAPAARLDDGRLDLVIVEAVGNARVLALLPALYRGDERPRAGIVRRSVSSLTVAADRPLTFYADGEPLFVARPEGTRIEVCPAALGVLA
jgi:diacylglycerol kinase (ATP)